MNENIRKKGIYERIFKRVIDFILALVATIILSPILLLLAIVGAIVMKGNPFFVQKRPGRIDKKTGQERIIFLVKFRTMTNKKDLRGNLLSDAERLVPYGKFLRSTSLDELPELFNILKGDLSCVGPRPLIVRYLPYYTEEERHRHDVRPGLTGLAQVNGRNTLSWSERFALDLQYVENINLLTDIKILIKTVKKVFKHEDIVVSGTEDSILDLDVERKAVMATKL